MKALILKDLYVLLYQKKMLGVLISLFAIGSIFFGDVGLLLTFLTVLCLVQVNASLAYDETSQWNRFANTLPIKKADIVKSKYAFSLLLLFLVLVIVLPVFFITNAVYKSFTFHEFLSLLCMIMSGLLFILSLTLPIFIRFGQQKAKISILAIIMIVIIASNVFSNGTFIQDLSGNLNFLNLVMPLIAIVIFYISFKIAVTFYESKEF